MEKVYRTYDVFWFSLQVLLETFLLLLFCDIQLPKCKHERVYSLLVKIPVTIETRRSEKAHKVWFGFQVLTAATIKRNIFGI
jgi:hypothetical protein